MGQIMRVLLVNDMPRPAEGPWRRRVCCGLPSYSAGTVILRRRHRGRHLHRRRCSRRRGPSRQYTVIHSVAPAEAEKRWERGPM